MIDLHCHILPGIDDGAQNMDESLHMARVAVSEGIHQIVATPHHQNGRYTNEKEDIMKRVEILNQKLDQEKIPLKILPGQESRIYGEIIQDYLLNKVLTLNNTTKYLFIEFPSNHVPRFTEQLLFNIQSEGITPIIVHPERNSRLLADPDILYNLVAKGALTQVTAASLTGQFGKKIKKFSFQLIESNLTHIIASDAHNTSSRRFCMAEAMNVIEKKYGLDFIYLFQENADAVINGKACFREQPDKVERKKFLGIF